MAQEDVRLSGTFVDSSGDALASETATAFSVGTITPALSTDTTDSSGRWDLTASTVGRIDAQLVTGSETFRIISLDKFQVTEIHGRNPTTAQPAGQFWSTVPIATETSSLVAIFGFRPAQESSGVETPDQPTDGVEGYIDYELSNDHTDKQHWIAGRFTWVGTDVSDGSEDGALAWDTMTAGTLSEKMRLDENGDLSINAAAKLFLDGSAGTGDTYIYEESADDLHVVVGGTAYIQIDQDIDAMSFGGAEAPLDYIGVVFNNAFTSGGSSTIGVGYGFRGSLTGASGDTASLVGVKFQGTVVTQTATETIGYIAGVEVNEPQITDNLTGDITVAASLYVAASPSEGETNAAIYTVSGDINMNGTSYLKLPIHDTDATAEGSIWYDASEDKLKFKTAAGVEMITSS